MVACEIAGKAKIIFDDVAVRDVLAEVIARQCTELQAHVNHKSRGGSRIFHLEAVASRSCSAIPA